IQNPTRGSYYAASVAGPVFREVADKVYAQDIQMYDPIKKEFFAGSTSTELPDAKAELSKDTQRLYKALGMKVQFASQNMSAGQQDIEEMQVQPGVVPDVTGMGLKDALFLLGNAGLRPIVKGYGKVVKQSVEAGMRTAKGFPVVIELN